MISRLAAVTVTLALVGCLTTGCQPEPDPSPSGPAFATEEEAFAAAEETYRAYVDALNQVDLSDPETFEAVYAWTTGELNAEERKTFSQMHGDGWTVGGTSEISRVDQLTANQTLTEIAIAACVDVSSVQLRDASGASQVSPDRPPVQSTRIELRSTTSSATGYLIHEIVGHELDPPCL